MPFGPSGDETPGFPAGLLSRFDQVEFLNSGTEALVFLARPRNGGYADAGRVVVKVYRDKTINPAQLDWIGRPDFLRHVPRLYSSGNVVNAEDRLVGWEAQEYCEPGTLHDLMTRRVGGFSDGEARALVRELADCLHFWQTVIGLSHTDIKPANVLVRRVNPYELVIGDFGGTALNTPSRELARSSKVLVTYTYAAPETLRERRRGPWPAWWALGVIVYELLTGRPPYPGMSGTDVFNLLREGNRPDLGEIRDPEWHRLLDGLLTVDFRARWGHTEVERWLKRERPVPRPATVHYQPIEFAGRYHVEPGELVVDMHDRWPAAIEWLSGAGGERLGQWLDYTVRDQGFDRAHLRRARGHLWNARLALAELGAHFLADTAPRCQNHEIDEAGLLELAAAGESGRALLKEIFDWEVLTVAARHDCLHPACHGRCEILERAAAEVPEVVRRAQRALGFHSRTVAASPPDERDWANAWGNATLLTLRPDFARRLLRSLPAAEGAPAWWPEVREAALNADTRRVSGRAALVVAGLLAPYAARSPAGAPPGGPPALARRADSCRWFAIPALAVGGLDVLGGGPDPLVLLVVAVLLAATVVAAASRRLAARPRLRVGAYWAAVALTGAVVLRLAITRGEPALDGLRGLAGPLL